MRCEEKEACCGRLTSAHWGKAVNAGCTIAGRSLYNEADGVVNALLTRLAGMSALC